MNITKLQNRFEIQPTRTGLDWALYQEPIQVEGKQYYKNTLVTGYFWKLPKYAAHIGLQIMDIMSMYAKSISFQFKNGWKVEVRLEVENLGIHVVGISENIPFSRDLATEFYHLVKKLVKDIKYQFRDELILVTKTNPKLKKRYGYLSKFL